MQEYLPLAMALVLSALFAGLVTILARALGPKRPTEAKLAPYECGIEHITPLRRRFPAKFYLVGMLLIVFDTELAFLFPWAAAVRAMGIVGYVEMLIFAVILLCGLFWIWRRGVFEWQ